MLDRGPHDGAVGEKDQVIGHAFGRTDEGRDCAGAGVDAIDAVTDYAAGVQHVVRIERETVHAVEAGRWHEAVELVALAGRLRVRRVDRDGRNRGQPWTEPASREHAIPQVARRFLIRRRGCAAPASRSRR
jgi:hypothetical protein